MVLAQLLALAVHIDSSVDCRVERVDHLHHARSIVAQVEVLDWILADVPLELVQTLILFRSEELEEEVESHFALTVKSCIFVHFQFHDFEMEYAGLRLCVEDFYPYSTFM